LVLDIPVGNIIPRAVIEQCLQAVVRYVQAFGDGDEGAAQVVKTERNSQTLYCRMLAGAGSSW